MIKKLKIIVRKDLLLSNLTYKDTKRQAELVVKNQHYLGKFLLWVPNSLTQKASGEKIKQDQLGLKNGESLEFGIFLNEKLIGRVGFHTIRGDTGEIGYFLDEDYTKKGIMTDCVKALITYGVDRLFLKNIIIRVHPDNLSSKAIPKRLGFSLEGTETVFKLTYPGCWRKTEVYLLSIL